MDYLSELSVEIKFKGNIYNKKYGVYEAINGPNINKQSDGKITTIVCFEYFAMKLKYDSYYIVLNEFIIKIGGINIMLLRQNNKSW